MFTTAGLTAFSRIHRAAFTTARRCSATVIVVPPSVHPSACTSTSVALGATPVVAPPAMPATNVP